MSSLPVDMSPERREQRRRRRRRKRQARAKNHDHCEIPKPGWMQTTKPSHQAIDVPHKLSLSLDDQTPTTQEPTLIDISLDDDLRPYYENRGRPRATNMILLHGDNDDSTCQESSALHTPTPRLPDEATLDDSLFSDRYSLTVSHHQKVTTIPLTPNLDSKQQEQHRKAVEQLRKTRRQHRLDGRGDASRSTKSDSSNSDFGTIGEFTFIGELQAVASDVSYFFASIRESLTEPHVTACCAHPTYISYRKRKPRRRR